MFYVIDRNWKTGNEVIGASPRVTLAWSAARAFENPKGTLYVTNEEYQPVDEGGNVLRQYRALRPDDHGF